MNGLLLLMGQNPQGSAGGMLQLFPFVFAIVIFYLLLIRPQQKRATEHGKFVAQLKNGDKVITDSGIFGTVVGVNDDSVVLKVADNVKLRFLKAKVAGNQPTEAPKKK